MKQYLSATKLGAGIVAAAVLSAMAFTAAPAKADKVADFYKGRDITFIVGFSTGGSYGVYSRLVAKYMGKYTPGNPTYITQHMSGGGGLKAANYLYNRAPKDGTFLGFLSDSLSVGQILFPKKAKFDASKMRYIGGITPVNPVVMVHKRHKVKTIQDVRKTELIIACSGRGSQTYIMPKAMIALLGMKFRHICGYKGSAPQTLAMARGDVDAQSSAWASWRIRHMDSIRNGTLIPLVQIGLKREKELPNVPLMQDLTNDKENKALLEFFSVGGAIGRSVIAAPGTPMDRVKALRVAFNKTMKDAGLLADAKKRRANIQPSTGEALDALTRKVLATDKDLQRKARNIMKGYKKNCKKNCKKKKKKKKKKAS